MSIHPFIAALLVMGNLMMPVTGFKTLDHTSTTNAKGATGNVEERVVEAFVKNTDYGGYDDKSRWVYHTEAIAIPPGYDYYNYAVEGPTTANPEEDNGRWSREVSFGFANGVVNIVYIKVGASPRGDFFDFQGDTWIGFKLHVWIRQQ